MEQAAAAWMKDEAEKPVVLLGELIEECFAAKRWAPISARVP